MRLPWIQVAMEVLEVSAPELAVRLDITDAEAFYALVRMMAWARARCPEDRPPSESDTITGPAAARVIAAGAQYRPVSDRDPNENRSETERKPVGNRADSDAENFVEVCCTLAFPVLERVPGGVRVKGLDRYDAAWAKNNPAKAAEWKLSRPVSERKPGENRSEPDRFRDGSGSDPAPQKQIQKQTQKLPSEAEEAPPPAEQLKVVPLPKKPDDPYASVEAFFAHIQHQRAAHGLVTEKLPNAAKLRTFWSEAGMEIGGDFRRLDGAYEHFSDDPYWKTKQPPWPFNAFMTEWRKHVPRATRTA